MAEGDGATPEKQERLSDEQSALYGHIAGLPAARTAAEIQTSYDLAQSTASSGELPKVGKQAIEDGIKSLTKRGMVKKVGNAGVDGDGDPAYSAVDEKGSVLNPV